YPPIISFTNFLYSVSVISSRSHFLRASASAFFFLSLFTIQIIAIITIAKITNHVIPKNPPPMSFIFIYHPLLSTLYFVYAISIILYTTPFFHTFPFYAHIELSKFPLLSITSSV